MTKLWKRNFGQNTSDVFSISFISLFMDNNKNYIRKIGSDIHSMSFIIGAGFSKNISDKYLSWGELLKDMIHEMYAKEMRSGYMNEWEIIDKYGYLGIASEYIRRKGYHEAIDVYIEQRTPVLICNDEEGKYDLKLGKEIQKDVDVSLHRTLLNMKVKNIYTFNYDNALDVYRDLTYTSERAREIRQSDSNLKQINDILSKVVSLKSDLASSKGHSSDEYKIADLKEDWDKRYEEIINNPVAQSVYDFQDCKGKTKKEILDEVYNAISLYRQQILESVIQWNTHKQDAYFVVKKSGDITIGDARRNIFKLHGSLRILDNKNECIDYGFDYDNHTQYIIAQEDYDSYSQKHEAFVDLMRISLLKDAYCIIGFSCDDPNFLLWINWVKDIVDREAAANKEENFWNKYFINVDNEELAPDKKLLLHNHYIRIVDLYKVYPTASSRKERLLAFFDDINKMRTAKSITNDFWEHFNFNSSNSLQEKNTVVYDKKKVDKIWNLTKDNPFSFFAKPFEYYRFYFLERIRNVIKARQMNESICKSFLMAANQDNLPLDVVLDDDEVDYMSDFVSSIEDVSLKESYKLLIDEGMVLDNKWRADGSEKTDKSILTSIMQCLFNFDFEKCSKLIKGWIPHSQYFRTVRFMILASLSRGVKKDELGNILTVHESNEYNNDQEYMVALELPLGLHEYFWGDKNFNAKSEEIQSKIEEIVSKNKDVMRLSDYFTRLQKELRKEEKVMPLGRSGRTMTFGSSDSVTLGAIRILQVLVKLGFVTRNTFARWVSNESVYQFVERIYTFYPYPCLYFASQCTNKDFSKRVAQLYSFSSSEEIQKVLPDILVKILRACSSEHLSEESKNTLYIYATAFIKRVHPKHWRKEFKTLYRKQDLGNRNEREYYETKYTFAQKAVAYMDDSSFSHEIIDSILDKGADMTHSDNALLIAATKNIKELSTEQVRKIYSLMDNTTNEPQVFVLFNMRNFMSKRKFYNWLEHLDKKLLKYPSLILAVSQVARQCKRFENLALSLLEESDYLWSTGINESDGHIVISGTQPIDVDTFDRDVCIKGDAEIKAFNLIKTELALLEKAQQSRFYEDWFQDWSTEVYSMKLFLVRHYKSFEDSKEVDELIKKCEHLYLCISGQNSLQEKLVYQESYKVEEGITELMKGVRTYGINHFLLEYEIIANLIMQHNTKALDMCIRHFSWAIAYKKYQNFFTSHNFQQTVLLILHIYKPYFIGKEVKEWNLHANKDAIEFSMIKMNDWLKGFGLADSDWNAYQPVYFYNEQ